MKRGLPKRMSRLQRDQLMGWVFCLPLVLGVLLILLPIIANSIRFSFSDMQMQDVGYTLEPVGWENYRWVLFVDPNFVRDTLTSLSSLAVTIPSIVVFALFIAVLLNQELPGRTLFRVVLFIPVILSAGYFETVMSGDVMTSSMSSLSSFDSGLTSSAGFFTVERVGEYLMKLNINSSVADFLITLMNGIYTVIQRSGVQILIFLAGLQSISPSLYESAQIEGATGWESFWKITVPVISPMILLNVLYSIIDAFTRASNPIMKSIQNATFGDFKYGQGAAMSWLYFILIFLFIAVVYAVAQKLVFYQERG